MKKSGRFFKFTKIFRLKNSGSFWKTVWKAGRKDFLLGLPWLPLYSIAEVGLALSAAVLVQLIFFSTPRISFASLVPGRLQEFIPLNVWFDRQKVLLALPLILAGVAFIKLVASFMSNYLTERAGHRVAQALRAKLLEKSLMLPGKQMDAMNPDEAANRIMQDTALLQSSLSKGTLSAFRDALVLLGIIITMLFISWEIFLISIFVIIPIAWSLKQIAIRINAYSRGGQLRQLGISTRLLQSHHGALTIHGLHTQYRESQDFEKLNQQNYQFMHKSLFVRTFFAPATEFIAICLLAGLFQWRLFATQSFAAQTYSALVILLAFSFRYIKNIAGVITLFSEMQVVLQRIQRSLNPLPSPSSAVLIEALPSSSSFALQAAHICYENVIKDVSLEIFKGQKVAFIGESGAGKTTFLRLIAGLLEPTQGRLLREEQCLLAPQFPYVFQGNVKDNIVYSTEDTRSFAEDLCQELILALSLAYSDSGAQIFLHKQLGFLGAGLSGGEKARVALARTLYANPRLLLLDEPTANLDAHSAALFWDAINAWHGKNPQEHTVIAVTHALHEIKHFHCYYTFEEGRIVSQKNMQK